MTSARDDERNLYSNSLADVRDLLLFTFTRLMSYNLYMHALRLYIRVSHRWYEVYLQDADAGRLPDFAQVKEIELPSKWWEGSLNVKPMG